MTDQFSKITEEQTVISNLGPAKITNPLILKQKDSGRQKYFVEDGSQVRLNPFVSPVCENGRPQPSPCLELAGPRETIYFDPTKLKAAIVTCGGICPGINSLVRAIVLQLHYLYGVSNVLGIRYGLQGFCPEYGHDVLELTPERVQNVHGRGGSFLGMSRGSQPMEEIVDSLERLNVSLLFMIGGDGTLRAAKAITKEITDRGRKIGVIAIPKTIDNDINFVEKTFGFQTAVEAATGAILAAHNEATGAPNGIGLVKLMGRHSGFVAAQATLALTEVNFCLIPEIDFDLNGDNGLLAHLRKRLEDRGHAVIVTAEGAGQKFFEGHELGRDASGNLKLGDIGTFLKKAITEDYRSRNHEINLKYIDPSYMIRSVPANSDDRIYTGFLGHAAVHAGMAGKTGMMVSLWNNHFVHVPLEMAMLNTRRVDTDGNLWRAVREATGQMRMRN